MWFPPIYTHFRFRFLYALKNLSYFSRYVLLWSDQFEEFLILVVGGFLPFGPTVRGRRRQPAHPPRSAKKFPFMQGAVHKWRHYLIRGKAPKWNKNLWSMLVKFIYSEKVTKFCEISTLDLSYVLPVKSMVEISQNFVAFSEYMNFKRNGAMGEVRVKIRKNCWRLLWTAPDVDAKTGVVGRWIGVRLSQYNCKTAKTAALRL